MQLDLFNDPLPQMNPNKNPIAPDCFTNYKQYSEWLGLARIAKEECTICQDCQPEYQMKMKMQSRCHYEWYSIQIVMKGRSIQPRPKAAGKVTKEIEYEKLFWEFLPSCKDIESDNEPSGC